MNDRRFQAGVTLVELLIALALTVVIVAQILMVFTSQHKGYVEQERVVETQQDVRILTSVVLDDLRMAGFMVPREAGVASVDGGAANPDVLCVSDASVINTTAFDDATDRLDGAPVTTNITGDETSVSISDSDADIDSDGDVDFVVGNGILISDGNRLHCATVGAVGSGSVTFSPAIPSSTSFAFASTVAVPAVVYSISGTQLSRNGLLLSDQVEDLQVEFGVDIDGDGNVAGAEFPLDDLNGQDPSKTRLVRIYLTSRTSQGDPDFSGQRPAAANRNAGAADTFKRRRAVADAVLRNMS